MINPPERNSNLESCLNILKEDKEWKKIMKILKKSWKRWSRRYFKR